jgi:FtsZ-binding cell division protein ZapB
MLKKILSFFHLYTRREYLAAVSISCELRKQNEELQEEIIKLRQERDKLAVENVNVKVVGIELERLRSENKRLKDKLKGYVKLKGKNAV